MTTLDLIIPTYNRSHLLRKTLQSVVRAKLPESLIVTIIVADNNSTDETRNLVETFKIDKKNIDLRYILAREQGSSQARNAGIAAGRGDLIGFVDDDEEIRDDWFEVVVSAFSDETLDYVGGSYEPELSVTIPDWFPTEYNGVIGIVGGIFCITPYSQTFPGVLMGGNAVFRRGVFASVGNYNADLGRKQQKQLMACEDREMYLRLLSAGMHGLYLPNLVIFHHIPAERMTVSYLRRWVFWHGVSMGVLDRQRPMMVPYLLGLPRYQLREFAMSCFNLLRKRTVRLQDASRLLNDLKIRDVVGFAYGKFLFRK